MWIDSKNFDILKGRKAGQSSLSAFVGEDLDMPAVETYKVAFNDLTATQKKELVDVEVDFKLYVSSGKVNPKLKSKVVKEPLHDKEDIVSLIKTITSETQRTKVIDAVMNSDIPPVVIQQWLFQGAYAGSDESWNTVVKAEQWTDKKLAYAYTVAGATMLGAKFKFPKKLRE